MAHEIRTRQCQRDVHYSKANVTSNQSVYGSSSPKTASGGGATYTPTSGASYVIVEYTVMVSDRYDYNNIYFNLQLSSDGTSFTSVGSGYTVAVGQITDNPSSNQYCGFFQDTFRWLVPTSIWSGERTTKIIATSEGNESGSYLHYLEYSDNANMDYYNPHLKIYSI